MDSNEPEQNRKVDRRTFLKGGLAAGGLLGAGLALREATQSGSDATVPLQAPTAQRTNRAARHRPTRPNILIIIVDQLRFPQWFSPEPLTSGLPRNIRRLSEEGVSFARHYTASNDCTPARSTLLTGLYTHQTGCMITGGSTLDPTFPTWGTMLRQHGYHTRWYGKWHLTHHDNHWTAETGEPELERYGFSGGTFPSPDGGPGQGWRVDPRVTQQFVEWFKHGAGEEPWCTTVSLVNPHDIAWWYRWTNRVPAERGARSVVRRLPPNFETPEALVARNKPRLQRSLQDTAAASFGAVPFTGPEALPQWLAFVDLYAKLQREVDGHVGRILETLESHPEVADNTVVVFTSDHGEYGASHGLRGKGASGYEEAIRVPLIVKDPRGLLTTAPGRPRTQLTSSVDVAPFLLTIAMGSDEWRREARYGHLAKRLDLARILADPSAPGRPYVLHATDEVVTEFAVEPYAADAPLHVVAMRTPEAKYTVYSHWPEEAITPLPEGREVELYDYGTHTGRLELHSSAASNPLEPMLRAQFEHAFTHELREPLPPAMQLAHGSGFADYFSIARRNALAAAAFRKVREEQELDPVSGPEGAALRGAGLGARGRRGARGGRYVRKGRQPKSQEPRLTRQAPARRRKGQR